MLITSLDPRRSCEARVGAWGGGRTVAMPREIVPTNLQMETVWAAMVVCGWQEG